MLGVAAAPQPGHAAAIFEVTTKILVDTPLGSFIIILI